MANVMKESKEHYDNLLVEGTGKSIKPSQILSGEAGEYSEG
jgi:hypothetical protein